MQLSFKPDLLSVLILLIGFGSILTIIFSSRDLSMGEISLLEEIKENTLIADTISRLFTAIILAVCGLYVLLVIQKNKMPPISGRIISYYLFFLFCTTLIPMIMHSGNLNIRLLYAPIVLFTAYVARQKPISYYLLLIKWVLLVYIYGSLFLVLLAPDVALMSNYGSKLPGVDTRLFGLATHANQLGPIAALYLTMEFLRPTYTKIRKIHLASALVVLIWAQCKTAWGFILLSVLYLFLLRVEEILFHEKRNRNFSKKVFYALGIFSGLTLLLMVMGFISITPESNANGSESFTGRSTIWVITLDAWWPNPVFGYGLDLWGQDFRAKYGLFNVGQAHNEFIHTLGSSGLLGLFGLITYLLALFKNAINMTKQNPMPLVLLCIIVVGSITESPLRNTGILNIYFLFHLLLLLQLRSVK